MYKNKILNAFIFKTLKKKFIECVYITVGFEDQGKVNNERNVRNLRNHRGRSQRRGRGRGYVDRKQEFHANFAQRFEDHSSFQRFPSNSNSPRSFPLKVNHSQPFPFEQNSSSFNCNEQNQRKFPSYSVNHGNIDSRNQLFNWSSEVSQSDCRTQSIRNLNNLKNVNGSQNVSSPYGTVQSAQNFPTYHNLYTSQFHQDPQSFHCTSEISNMNEYDTQMEIETLNITNSSGATILDVDYDGVFVMPSNFQYFSGSVFYNYSNVPLAMNDNCDLHYEADTEHQSDPTQEISDNEEKPQSEGARAPSRRLKEGIVF